MTQLGTAAAWLVAATFAWAAVAKARAPRRTERGFEALGLPRPRLLARAVPAAELVVGVLLVLAPPVGAICAITLLAAFTSLLAQQVRTGAEVACGCFGSSGAEPVSVADLVRNALLLVAAVVALWGLPGLPTLPAVVAVGAAAATGLMLHGLVRLKVAVGVVWDNRLPGEPVAS